MLHHRFTSAFKGDHRSPCRGTVHSQNTRQSVYSLAPQINIQRSLQRALLANANRFTRMQIGLHNIKWMTQSHCHFSFVLKIMLVHVKIWPDRNAGRCPEKVVGDLVALWRSGNRTLAS